MKKVKARATKEQAEALGLKPNASGRYRVTQEQYDQLNVLKSKSGNSFQKAQLKGYKQKVKVSSKSDSNDYNKSGVLSALNDKGKLMNIDEYCLHYNLPKCDISSYKLVTHTGTPFFNIVFREVASIESIDFDTILSKYKNFKPSKGLTRFPIREDIRDFDTLTYTDVHIAMETNADNNSMYAIEWNKKCVLESLKELVLKTIRNKRSETLVIDELGDFLDGLNGYTTRGGHKLPQNMTDEEAFDLGLHFKIKLIGALQNQYENIIVNNICNDNHAGSFGYFVNSAAKRIIENLYDNVTVNNHRQFINHYFVGDICFLITHGKDDKTLKFGFKPQLDSKGLEKIDQYCKQNDIYKKAKKIVFKKGDSHQALFDMCTSDDFYYFNYPALSPSSQWVQNNFKKGRRGFVLESWRELDVTIKPIFL